MDEGQITRMTPWELARWLRAQAPDNRHRDEGYALVDVRDFAMDSVPGSMPLSVGDPRQREIEALARRFSPEKVIVVYGTDAADHRPGRIANALAGRGFRRIRLLDGGPADWRGADARLAPGARARRRRARPSCGRR